MNEIIQKRYWVGDDAVFIPGDEAGELNKVHGITDSNRQEAVHEGVAAAIRVYLSDPEIIESRSNQPSPAKVEDFMALGGRREMLCSQCKRPLGEIALRDETMNRTRARGQRKLLAGLRPSRLVNKAAHTGQRAGKQGRAVKPEYVQVDLTLPEYLEKEFTIIQLPTPQRSLLTDPREFPGQDQANSSLTELPEY